MTLTLIITHCCFLLCIHHDIFFILRKAHWSKIENEVRHVYLEWSKEPNQIGHFYDLILLQDRLHKWNLSYNMFYGATVWGAQEEFQTSCITVNHVLFRQSWTNIKECFGEREKSIFTFGEIWSVCKM